jgi:hypothetical protein
VYDLFLFSFYLDLSRTKFKLHQKSENFYKRGKMVKVVFLHPDLGIGGAERLVVDAALALQSKGHQVHIVTSYHDPGHCFPETKDGTIAVTVSGNWLPRSICG